VTKRNVSAKRKKIVKRRKRKRPRLLLPKRVEPRSPQLKEKKSLKR